MGQCCLPSKDGGSDMRDGKRSKKGKKELEENTFKRQLDGKSSAPSHSDQKFAIKTKVFIISLFL